MSPEYNWHVKANLKSDTDASRIKELLYLIDGVQMVNDVAPLMTEDSKDKEYFSQVGAAKYLSVHPKTIYRLARAGQLPQYRLGGVGHPRYLKEDLDELLRPIN